MLQQHTYMYINCSYNIYNLRNKMFVIFKYLVWRDKNNHFTILAKIKIFTLN